MKLGGGSNGKTVRRLWAGGFELVDTTGKDPLTVECAGGSDTVVVDANDARQAYELWKTGTTFAATFPGVLADGTDLTVTKAVILNAPTFKFKLGQGGLYRVATYSFTVTILDDY